MPARFRPGLPSDVAELSRLFTSQREDRGNTYLGKPALLSAYLRYFLPWNVYRLCRLFCSLPLDLKLGDAINDLGAGPLTLPIALWISRPDLRKIPLEFRCLDRTAAVMEAGKKIFTALTAANGPAEPAGIKSSAEPGTGGYMPGGPGESRPWVIKTIRGELQTRGSRARLSTEIRGKLAAFTAAVNLYNEIYFSFSRRDSERLEEFAEAQARLLTSLTEGSILVAEPGIPQSGEFISLLRSALMAEGGLPLSPCIHSAACPLPGGGREKWCHFNFDTEDAPAALHKLSAQARIPKERAVLSYIFTAGAGAGTKPSAARRPDALPAAARIISDAFPLDGAGMHNSWGRYGCSKDGLVLVSGSRREMELMPSGAGEEISLSGQRDKKSGALLAASNKHLMVQEG